MARKPVSLPPVPTEDGDIETIDVAGFGALFAGPFGLAALERAIPDVRDGLIPVRRRILFGADEMGLRFAGKTRKSAQLVGEVMGKYHPHGDSSIYGAIINMAAPYEIRYPLLVGQGNMGSIDGDPAAAMRYTEVKLSALGEQIVRDLENARAAIVDWGRNYSEELAEPATLPSRFPVLLANGTTGIGYGDATFILPHNLRELISSACALIDDPALPIEQLAKLLPGPDFPGGSLIVGNDDWTQILETGQGRIIARARMHVEQEARETRLVVTELPFGLQRGFKDNQNPGVEGRIVERVNGQGYTGKPVEPALAGIVADVRNESSREAGTRLVIVLEKGVTPERAAAALFRYTDLQSAYSVSQKVSSPAGGGLAVVERMGTRHILLRYAAYQFDVLTRRTRYQLERAIDALALEEAIIVAHGNAEELVRMAKVAANREALATAIETTYAARLDPAPERRRRQAEFIADLPLRRYAKLDMDGTRERIGRLRIEIAEYQRLLGARDAMNGLLKTELGEIATKFGDDRRSEIDLNASAEVPSQDDILPDEPCYLVVTASGLVARHAATAFRAQKRGGAGATATKGDDDPIVSLIGASTRDRLWLLTDAGNLFGLRVADIDEVPRGGKGTNVRRFLSIGTDEKVVRAVRPPADGAGEVVIATANGKVLRSRISDYANLNAAGLKAIGLAGADRIIAAVTAAAGVQLLFVTSDGYAARWDIDDAPINGRGSQGVASVSVGAGATVVSMDVVTPADPRMVLTIGTTGKGKRTKLAEYPTKGRAIRGVRAMDLVAVNGATPRVAFSAVVSPRDDVILATRAGKAIVTGTDEIRAAARDTAGVAVVTPVANDEVAVGAVIGTDKPGQGPSGQTATAKTKPVAKPAAKAKPAATAKPAPATPPLKPATPTATPKTGPAATPPTPKPAAPAAPAAPPTKPAARAMPTAAPKTGPAATPPTSRPGPESTKPGKRQQGGPGFFE